MANYYVRLLTFQDVLLFLNHDRATKKNKRKKFLFFSINSKLFFLLEMYKDKVQLKANKSSTTMFHLNFQHKYIFLKNNAKNWFYYQFVLWIERVSQRLIVLFDIDAFGREESTYYRIMYIDQVLPTSKHCLTHSEAKRDD